MAQSFAMQRNRYQQLRQRVHTFPHAHAEHRCQRTRMAELFVILKHLNVRGNRLAILERNNRMVVLGLLRLATAAYAGRRQLRAADFAAN